MIQVREYATLTTDTSVTPSLDTGVVSPALFDWLVAVSGKAAYLTLTGGKSLKLDSFVGYLESPQGEAIEVLPKTGFGQQDPGAARQVLRKMLCSALKLTPRETGPAHLARMKLPLHEWIFAQFLSELKALVSKGLRFDYERIEEESRFIRGQLNMAAQQRQPPGRANVFHIRHDLYTPNRIENRLIRTALNYVLNRCRNPENWRTANELSHILDVISPLRDPLRELPKWASSKLMQGYEPIQPWTRLILERLNPNFQQGKHRGIALMFPMEKLFEEHVAVVLGRKTVHPWQVKAQSTKHSLVVHHPTGASKPEAWFNLRPDLLLYAGKKTQVLDIKWKLLDERQADGANKYKLGQGDFYQLFAYGQNYQDGQGDMMLIFPQHAQFSAPLPCFVFTPELRLWVVPFCLEQDKLIPGEWQGRFQGLAAASLHGAAANSPAA